jgi:2-(1,2-epoxy-1,2-dihydrophenyl)acetyl-CoA isomerase
MNGDPYADRDGLRVECDSRVLRLILDRPAKRNALDDTMVDGLVTAIDAAGSDEDVRVIVITGAGDHFCGGFDIVSRNRKGGERRPRVGSIQRRMRSQSHSHALIPLIATVQTPVVSVVRGWAAGVGLHVLLASDFAVVADDARVWEPFAERGFTPDSGGTWLLPRRIGETRAREMLLLGRALSGAEAAEWGLVHAAVPAGELDERAAEVIERLAAGPTVTLGLTKWLLHAGNDATLAEHLQSEGFAMELSSRSDDFKEGLAAFVEKRPPEFRGR